VDYQLTGQPVLIGGTMGTCSYILTGTERGMVETFGSTCHGAVMQSQTHFSTFRISLDWDRPVARAIVFTKILTFDILGF